MSEIPRFGQYAQVPRKEMCPRHPGDHAVDYCKRCNRPTCIQCTIPTEVGSICVDCAKAPRRLGGLISRAGQPIVTYVLIAICVVAFGVDLVWPTLGNFLAFHPVVAYVQPWRFLTVVFVHGGWLHLIFNMMMLYFIGAAVERAAGHWRFLGLFFLSALGGSVLVLGWALIDPTSLDTATVGASGALYGMFGAVFVEQKRSGISTRSIVILLAINLIYSFSFGGISWQSHVGGLIVGGLVAWLYLILAKPRAGVTARAQTLWAVGATIGVTVILGLIAYGIYQILIGQGY